MAQAGVFAGLSLDEFRNRVSRLVSMMGYSIESSREDGDDFLYEVSKPEPLGPVKTLIYVYVSEKKVSHSKVKHAIKLAGDSGALKVVLLSTSGFSESALKLAGKQAVTVIDKTALEDLMRKYGFSDSKRDKIFEFAFGLGKNLREARDYFEKDCGKKFLGFGVEEKVVEVVGRYVPVGSFLLTRDEEVKTGFSKTLKTAEKSNMFYVNLNSGELYYISKGLGKPVKLQQSNIIGRLMHLPIESVKILAYILKKGEVSTEELNQRYELFYQENRNDFVLLLEEGLVAPTPNKDSFMPTLTLPDFDNPRFDVKKFTSISKSVSSNYSVDELKYHPEDIVKLLELFFSGKGHVREVIYLPYYTCNYSDDRGRSRSKVLLAVKYSV